MTLRHAAALALVGWYLMVPTSFTETPKGPTWGPKKRLTFDSYRQCNDYRQGLIVWLQRSPRFPLPDFVVAKCIQFDDRVAD